MPVLIEIVLAIAVVALVVSYLMRGRREAERQDVIERRVEAYMQTIRREGGTSELAQMTDVELKDLLLSSARNLRLQMERKWYLLLGGGVVGFFGAILVGTQDGARGFGITVLLAGLVLYGINEFITRRAKEPLAAHGIDAERLRVE